MELLVNRVYKIDPVNQYIAIEKLLYLKRNYKINYNKNEVPQKLQNEKIGKYVDYFA